MDTNLAIAGRARAGEPLTAAELDELASMDVLSLGMLADDVRRARVGGSVTYRRVLEVDGAEGPAGAAGAEVRIIALGASLSDTVTRVRSWRERIGRSVQLTGFSLADLVDSATKGWGPLTDVLRQLRTAGLDAIVEAPVDRLQDPASALQACQDAAMPVGCLSFEKPTTGSHVTRLLAVRAIGDRFPSITTLAPLPRQQSVALPTTGFDDVRVVALARLALPGLPNIQVDWAQYGPKLAQVALTFGASDLDRVSASDDDSLGRRRTAVADVTRNITAAGFVPVERSVSQ